MKKEYLFLTLLMFSFAAIIVCFVSYTLLWEKEPEPIYVSVTATPLPTAKLPTATSSPQVTLTVTPLPPTICSYDATFREDVSIPDGVNVVAGADFTKIWRVQSSGCLPWPMGSRLVYQYGELMSQKETPVSISNAGTLVDIRVEMKAPLIPGEYTATYSLIDPYGYRFGEVLYVQIKVIAATATPNPSVTPTQTPAASVTPSITPSVTPTTTATTDPNAYLSVNNKTNYSLCMLGYQNADTGPGLEGPWDKVWTFSSLLPSETSPRFPVPPGKYVFAVWECGLGQVHVNYYYQEIMERGHFRILVPGEEGDEKIVTVE